MQVAGVKWRHESKSKGMFSTDLIQSAKSDDGLNLYGSSTSYPRCPCQLREDPRRTDPRSLPLQQRAVHL